MTMLAEAVTNTMGGSELLYVHDKLCVMCRVVSNTVKLGATEKHRIKMGAA